MNKVGSPAKVLIVDDDDAVLRLQAKILGAHGFEVREARSSLEALAAVCSEEFSLVLIDLMLPGMSGLELCRRIREDGNADLPIVFITAKGAAEASAAAGAAGGVRFVLKPFSASTLVREVRRALGQEG